MTVLTNRIIYILSLLGVQVAGYLTLAHLEYSRAHLLEK